MIELYESNLLKMTTAQKKAQCVSCFIETKSDVHTNNWAIFLSRGINYCRCLP